VVELIPGLFYFTVCFRAELGFEILLDFKDFFLIFYTLFRVLPAEFMVDVNGFPPVSLVEQQLRHSFGLDRQG